MTPPDNPVSGTTYLYESLDRRDTVANLGLQSQVISSIAYGGRLNEIDQPDVFYVGTVESNDISFPRILHRVNVGGPITVLNNYPGGSVRSIVMDPENYRHVFVADTLGRVWASFDEGQFWEDITLNLAELTQDIRVLETFYLKDSDKGMKLVVGGQKGVFILEHIKSKRAKWKKLNKDLPHGIVFDLHFDTTDQLLVTSFLGRGAWILQLPSEKALRLEQRQRIKKRKRHEHSSSKAHKSRSMAENKMK